MLNIYICEANQKQRKCIEKIICDSILMNNYDMDLALSTSDPDILLNYLKSQNNPGLYFFDTHIQSEKDGLYLAHNIREYDPYGYIVFVTAHAEMITLTFKYKVEALDYIIKDQFINVKEQIQGCIDYAYKQYLSKMKQCDKILNIKANDSFIYLNFEEILYIETSATAHKLIVHTNERIIEFYSKMKEIMDKLDSRFYRCHNSYIINKDHVKELDLKNRCARLSNDDVCLISVRMLKKLLE